MQIRWEGTGVEEKGFLETCNLETCNLETCNLQPATCNLAPDSRDKLVAEMVREDLKSAERDELVKKHGYKTMNYQE